MSEIKGSLEQVMQQAMSQLKNAPVTDSDIAAGDKLKRRDGEVFEVVHRYAHRCSHLHPVGITCVTLNMRKVSDRSLCRWTLADTLERLKRNTLKRVSS